MLGSLIRILTLPAFLSLQLFAFAQNPAAVDDNYETFANNTLGVANPGVLMNDSGSQAKVAVLVQGPKNADFFILYENGGFGYTPKSNSYGEDFFTYQVRDGAALSAPATVRITIKPFEQSINFPELPPHKLGELPFNLNASATSGRPVTYVSSDPSVASIANNTVTIKALGRTVITASQNGSGPYGPAEPVSRELVITIDPTLFRPVAYYRFGEHDIDAAAGNAIATTIDSAVVGSLAMVGDVSYSADVAPEAAAAIAASLSAEFNSGGGYFLRSVLSASDGIGIEAWVKSTAMEGSRCIVYNGIPGANGLGLYQSADTFSARIGASEIPAAPSQADGEWHHLALIRSGGKATFYIDGNQIGELSNAAGTPTGNLAIGANPQNRDQDRFEGFIDEVRIFTVSLGHFALTELLPFSTSQTIGFETLESRTVGDPAFSLTAVASSGLLVAYSSSDVNVARITSGNRVTIVGPGITTITARQRGDGQFAAARPVSQTLLIKSASAPPTLSGAFSGNGFQIEFGSGVGGLFRVFGTSDITKPLAEWNLLGETVENPPGNFRFTDEAANSKSIQFYRVQSP